MATAYVTNQSSAPVSSSIGSTSPATAGLLDVSHTELDDLLDELLREADSYKRQSPRRQSRSRQSSLSSAADISPPLPPVPPPPSASALSYSPRTTAPLYIDDNIDDRFDVASSSNCSDSFSATGNSVTTPRRGRLPSVPESIVTSPPVPARQHLDPGRFSSSDTEDPMSWLEQQKAKLQTRRNEVVESLPRIQSLQHRQLMMELKSAKSFIQRKQVATQSVTSSIAPPKTSHVTAKDQRSELEAAKTHLETLGTGFSGRQQIGSVSPGNTLHSEKQYFVEGIERPPFTTHQTKYLFSVSPPVTASTSPVPTQQLPAASSQSVSGVRTPGSGDRPSLVSPQRQTAFHQHSKVARYDSEQNWIEDSCFPSYDAWSPGPTTTESAVSPITNKYLLPAAAEAVNELSKVFDVLNASRKQSLSLSQESSEHPQQLLQQQPATNQQPSAPGRRKSQPEVTSKSATNFTYRQQQDSFNDPYSMAFSPYNKKTKLTENNSNFTTNSSSQTTARSASETVNVIESYNKTPKKTTGDNEAIFSPIKSTRTRHLAATFDMSSDAGATDSTIVPSSAATSEIGSPLFFPDRTSSRSFNRSTVVERVHADVATVQHKPLASSPVKPVPVSPRLATAGREMEPEASTKWQMASASQQTKTSRDRQPQLSAETSDSQCTDEASPTEGDLVILQPIGPGMMNLEQTEPGSALQHGLSNPAVHSVTPVDYTIFQAGGKMPRSRSVDYVESGYHGHHQLQPPTDSARSITPVTYTRLDDWQRGRPEVYLLNDPLATETQTPELTDARWQQAVTRQHEKYQNQLQIHHQQQLQQQQQKTSTTAADSGMEHHMYIANDTAVENQSQSNIGLTSAGNSKSQQHRSRRHRKQATATSSSVTSSVTSPVHKTATSSEYMSNSPRAAVTNDSGHSSSKYGKKAVSKQQQQVTPSYEHQSNHRNALSPSDIINRQHQGSDRYSPCSQSALSDAHSLEARTPSPNRESPSIRNKTPRFVRDSSKLWHKPRISRDEAINMLKSKLPGSFVIRNSNSFPGAFGLALKVAHLPPNAHAKGHDPQADLVRHFLIEPTAKGVRLKGCSTEPVFASLAALVYQHSLTPLSLPCKLIIPELPEDDSDFEVSDTSTLSTAQQILNQGAACNVLYVSTVDTESLTGPEAIAKSVDVALTSDPSPNTTVVHFKVSAQGITLTDLKHKLFFRRHYPVESVSFCGIDPDDRRWGWLDSDTQLPCSARLFGFVARKQAGMCSPTDNSCHLFGEIDPEQPAEAVVNFIMRVMLGQRHQP